MIRYGYGQVSDEELADELRTGSKKWDREALIGEALARLLLKHALVKTEEVIASSPIEKVSAILARSG